MDFPLRIKHGMHRENKGPAAMLALFRILTYLNIIVYYTIVLFCETNALDTLEDDEHGLVRRDA